MSQYDVDLFVIGAGSGGVRAARMAASFGADVAIAEDRHPGGTCVNVGCVPKKLYVYGSQFSESFQNAEGFGWQIDDIRFDWPTLRDNKTSEINRLQSIYRNLLQQSGVNLIEGRASLVDAHTVSVGEQRFTADKILIATGGWPYVPDFPGREHVITSNEIFDLEVFPKRAIVVGGGYIALEFAGILNGLGAQTMQLYRGDLFLKHFDDDIRSFVADEISQKGVDLQFNCNIASVVKQGDGSLLATLTDGRRVETDLILYATGRKPKLEGLGLEELGVERNDDDTIAVNEYYQTNISSIFALGDIIPGPELTPVATAEAMAFAKTQFNQQPETLDYSNIPTAVFCQPNIGSVGLTEREAREQYRNIEVYKSSFRPMKHTLSGRNEKTFVKLIVDRTTNRVLGAHIVGEDAGEIIQGIAIAIKAGATKQLFDQTIGIHPTTAEEFVTLREPSA